MNTCQHYKSFQGGTIAFAFQLLLCSLCRLCRHEGWRGARDYCWKLPPTCSPMPPPNPPTFHSTGSSNRPLTTQQPHCSASGICSPSSQSSGEHPAAEEEAAGAAPPGGPGHRCTHHNSCGSRHLLLSEGQFASISLRSRQPVWKEAGSHQSPHDAQG